MLGSRPGLVTNNFQIPDTLYLGSSPAIVETELTPISSSFIAELDSPHGGWKGRTLSWVNFLLFHLNFFGLFYLLYLSRIMYDMLYVFFRLRLISQKEVASGYVQSRDF